MWYLQNHDAILFDCDGTLADTMPAHYRAWLGITQPHGIDFDEDRFYSLGGRPTRDIIAQLAAEAGVELDARGNVKADTSAYRTSVPRLFAAGDMRRGQSLVVWAIREGRQCARAIDESLMGASQLPR